MSIPKPVADLLAVWATQDDAGQTIFCDECNEPVAIVEVRGPARTKVIERVRRSFNRGNVGIGCIDHREKT